MNPENKEVDNPIQVAELAGPEAPTPDAVSEQPESKSKPEKKKLSFWRRTFRFLLLALIFFGLGAIAAIYSLYLPLSQTIDSNANGLQAAEQKISELEVQNKGIQTLEGQMQTLEEQNQSLTEQLAQTGVRISLLSVKADVASAQVALNEENLDKTRVLLNKASKTLVMLSDQLPEDQRPLVKEMQTRLDLALSELEKQAFAAKSDLSVLMTSLLDLESILFR